jgi:hypothetical protein
MEARKKEIHTQKGEKASQESYNGHDGSPLASPPYGQTLMKQGRVEKPSNQ